MKSFTVNRREARKLTAVCYELGIATRVFYNYANKTERVDVYAPEADAVAALEMSGVKTIN